METRILKATGHMPEDREVMELASNIISNGGLCAIPTETVYGLAGNALDPEASKKIYKAKGRPSDNPLIVHISDINDLDKIAVDIPESAYLLAEKFWPGPLTMILKKRDNVPMETTGGLNTVAVRMPSNRIAAEFISACGGFIAAPSANVAQHDLRRGRRGHRGWLRCYLRHGFLRRGRDAALTAGAQRQGQKNEHERNSGTKQDFQGLPSFLPIRRSAIKSKSLRSSAEKPTVLFLISTNKHRMPKQTALKPEFCAAVKMPRCINALLYHLSARSIMKKR